MNMNCQRRTRQGATPHTRKILLWTRRVLVLARVLGLCANGMAYAQPGTAQPAVNPEQKFPPGYLEAISTGYDNGQAMRESEDMAPARMPPRAGLARVGLPAAPAPAPAAPAAPAKPVMTGAQPGRATGQ